VLKLGPSAARGGLDFAQLFHGFLLVLPHGGDLLGVLGAHPGLRLRGLILPLDHLGVPLVELRLEVFDVGVAVHCGLLEAG
jgi:hypothetical protein